MRLTIVLLTTMVSVLSQVVWAQDLAPRAYVIAPVHTNVLSISSSFLTGGVSFNGAVPLTDTSGTFSANTVNYYHSFSFFGRSANVVVLLPYAIGDFQGTKTSGEQRIAHLSGMQDSAARFAVNLKGGPAMQPAQFGKWRQKMLLGASVKVIFPTGQYDPTKLVNWGINRWGFKPEFGYSERWGKWVLDGYAGMWFFTINQKAFSLPTPQPQTLSPIGSVEGHISYDVKPKLWIALNSNFWRGGTATVGGITEPETRQTSARIGATTSIPLTQHQAVKISYSRGAYGRFGSNYQTVSVVWQYGWIGWPK